MIDNINNIIIHCLGDFIIIYIFALIGKNYGSMIRLYIINDHFSSFYNCEDSCKK